MFLQVDQEYVQAQVTAREQAVEMVSKEDIAEGSIMTSQDPQVHIDSIQEAIDAGYDHVYTHQIGDDQAALIDMYEEEILPSFS